MILTSLATFFEQLQTMVRIGTVVVPALVLVSLYLHTRYDLGK